MGGKQRRASRRHTHEGVKAIVSMSIFQSIINAAEKHLERMKAENQMTIKVATLQLKIEQAKKIAKVYNRRNEEAFKRREAFRRQLEENRDGFYPIGSEGEEAAPQTWTPSENGDRPTRW